MPDKSAVAALVREYGTQFTAGFFTAAVAVAAIYAALEPPTRAASVPKFDVIKRLSFASSLSEQFPAKNTPVIMRSRVIDSASDGRYQRANTTPLLQAAAYELAGRFAELTPVVSPVIPARPGKPADSTASNPQDEQAPQIHPTAVHPAAHTALRSEIINSGDANEVALASQSFEQANILPPPALESEKSGIANQLSEAPRQPAPSVRLSLTRSRTSTTRIAFPLDLNPAWSERRDVGILVGGLPKGVTLSTGRRTALGLWKLVSADARTTQIAISPAAPAEFALTILLLDPDGLVVNGIDLVVALQDAGPGATAKEASTSASATPIRSSKRRGIGYNLHRQKSQEARHIVQKAKRFQGRQALTTRMKSST